MIKRTCILLLSLYIQINGYTQKRHFQHLTSIDGLSQSEVYSFLEDSRGFMWIGTVYGLNRYDGYNITQYISDKENPNEITNNTIRSLHEDQWGRVWIGTDDGLNVYDPKLEKIHQINIPDYQSGSWMINSILINDKDILLATSKGLLKADISIKNYKTIGSSFHTVQLPDEIDERVDLIKEDEDGVIWLSTSTTISSILFKDDVEIPFLLEHITSELLEGIRGFTHDNEGNIWIGTFRKGLFRYNIKKRELNDFKPSDTYQTVTSSNISAVTQDHNGNLWVATRDRGLLYLSSESLNDDIPVFESIQKNPFNDRSLNSNLIFSLYFSEKLLWIGTIGSGVNIYDPQQKEFNHYKIPPDLDENASGSNFIRSVYGDERNNIWIGTHSNGLFLFNRSENTFKKFGFGTQSIFHIEEFSKKELLICTGKGLYIANTANGKSLQITDSAINYPCFNAQRSIEEYIWVATLKGLVKCKYINGEIVVERIWNTSTNPSISLNNCRVLQYDSISNKIYLGTEGGGLNMLTLNDRHNVEDITIYENNESTTSLRNNFIRSIELDENQNIWLGTYEGLSKIIKNDGNERLSFRNYTTKDGLPNNMIQFIVEDNNAMLWAGTNNGLAKFNPKTEEFIQYSMSDGIQSNEFSEHAVYKKPDGEIIAGGINGINTFYPKNIKPSSNEPNTHITNFYLFNKEASISQDDEDESPLKKSIVYTDSLLLLPNQTSFGFEFSALTFSNTEKVKYAYKLEGFDDDWNYTDGSNRLANYTNLEYGRYFFKVKSTNNDGHWEEHAKQIYIHIRTPFVFTWAAYIIYMLFIILLIIYFTNYSVIKLTTKKKMILENEHNQQLHELDQLRTRFFINISHDLRTPLTLINSPLSLVLKDNSLKEQTKNRLKIAYRNVEKLRYITEQILDISKAEAGKLTCKPKNGDFVKFIKMEIAHFTDAIKDKGLTLKVTFDQPSYQCSFDPDIVSKIFFNLLSNAIKYTKEGEINIKVNLVEDFSEEDIDNRKHDQFLKLEIEDSGTGIPEEDLIKVFDRFYQGNNKNIDGYGIGLSHCKDLIEAHDGFIKAQNINNSGTLFNVFIPFISLAKNETNVDHKPSPLPKLRYDIRNDIDSVDSSKVNTHLDKILIVEDNIEMRTFIREELKDNYKIIEADDGEEGLKMVEKHHPDLILSDIMMPNMDGIEFCQRIKSDKNTSQIPIILLTAKGDSETKFQGLEKGADDYIAKPFEIDYLIIKIKNLLKSKEQNKKNYLSSESLEPSSVEVSSADREFLAQLMKVIEDGIPDPDFTVKTLETEMGMSHTNLYRKIKQLTGRSSKDILMDMRMKRAKQILSDSDKIRISDVAYNVGFSNPKYFSKCFKEYYGVLPSDFN